MFAFVTILGRDGARIFIDGSVEVAGTAPGPFVVPFGTHSFETRSLTGRPTATLSVLVDRDLEIELIDTESQA